MHAKRKMRSSESKFFRIFGYFSSQKIEKSLPQLYKYKRFFDKNKKLLIFSMFEKMTFELMLFGSRRNEGTKKS